MKWSKKLDNWSCGKNLPKPSTGVIWRTSSIDPNESTDYKEEYVPVKFPAHQDWSDFSKHLLNTSKKVVAFWNIKRDAILVVPVPDGNNYGHLYNFVKNAPIELQQLLWAKVAKVVRKMLTRYPQIWVSTHGFGVLYLHIRVSILPKYYGDSQLAQD
jgi:hypothetical protein